MKKLATEYQRFKNVVENVPSFEAIVDDEQGQYTHKLNSTRLYLRRMGVFSDPITKTPLQGFINGAYFTSYDVCYRSTFFLSISILCFIQA